jgi:hypothetical protein
MNGNGNGNENGIGKGEIVWLHIPRRGARRLSLSSEECFDGRFVTIRVLVPPFA